MTCEGFIENNGMKMNPKNVFIHVGARDLQNTHGVQAEDFNKLFEIASKTWPEANIFSLPIIRRKDMSNEKIRTANTIIAKECAKFGNIILLDKFEPKNDMFYDQVHLNSQKGLPAIVKYLKTVMNLYPANESKDYTNFHEHRSYRGPRRDDYSNQQPFVQPQHAPYQQKFNNFEIDRPPPNHVLDVSQPPWTPPPNHLLPWQNPWLWQAFAHFNQVRPQM